MEEAAEKEKSIKVQPELSTTYLCPRWGTFSTLGKFECNQHIRSFKNPLILALFFCFKTKVRIINSLKSFKTPAPSIRGPSEYPEEYASGRGSVSFLRAPRAAPSFLPWCLAPVEGAGLPGLPAALHGKESQVGEGADLSSFRICGGRKLISRLSHKYIENI